MLWECPAANITNTTREQWAGYVKWLAPYIYIGGITVLGNVFVIAAIVKHRNKYDSKYYLIGALAGGDMCQGLAFFTAGVMRLVTVNWGTHKVRAKLLKEFLGLVIIL